MRPYSIYPLLAASILDNDFQDLLLMSFLAAMDEGDEFEGESGDENDFDDEDDEDSGEESVAEESEDEEATENEPVPPKRRHLSNVASQLIAAGTSAGAGGSSVQIVRQLRPTSNPAPGPPRRPTLAPVSLMESVQMTSSGHGLGEATREQTQRLNSSQQIPNPVSTQNPRSRSQQIQSDPQENTRHGILNRDLLQLMPQSRVVLMNNDIIPNDIADRYQREE